MLGVLLQGSLNVAQDASSAASGTEIKSILDLIFESLWIMVPLALMSLLTVYLFVERFLTIQAASKMPESFMSKVKEQVQAGDINGAKEVCESEKTPISRMVLKGITRIGNPLKDIEVAIENNGKVEVNRLERNLSILATISGAAPMLGFLGTVLGMIKAFRVMHLEGRTDIAQMAGGIYEAMITTAAGLIVGLFAYVAYNYLSAVLQKVIHNMEHTAVDFIDLLQEPSKR
jgi:biopolymer transport protein ExbB